WNMGKMVTAGGIYSSIVDLAELMIAQMAAYKTANHPNSDHPLVLTNAAVESNSQYGYGFFQTGEEGELFGHGGDLDGFASTYLFSTKHNVGLIILTSSGGRWTKELEGQLFARLTRD
ncbi:MAG: serine hydrolase, partial [Bacteroidota bacterium]